MTDQLSEESKRDREDVRLESGQRGVGSVCFSAAEFTAGLQYSWGDGLTDDFLTFGEDENGNVIASSAEQVVTYRRLKALLGFNLPFNVPGNRVRALLLDLH